MTPANVFRNARHERLDFWRCRRGSIFCGGYYRPGSRRCTNCLSRMIHRRQSRSRATRDGAFYLYVQRSLSRFQRRGGNLVIVYSKKLFQSRRAAMVSYARQLYERVTGEDLPTSTAVVNLSRKHRPEFEDLMVVPRANTREQRVALLLNDLD